MASTHQGGTYLPLVEVHLPSLHSRHAAEAVEKESVRQWVPACNCSQPCFVPSCELQRVT